MRKVNAKLEAARKAYREALDAARINPTPESWARLLASGKELSLAQDPKGGRTGARRSRRDATPTYSDLEGPPAEEAQELERID